MAERVLIFGDRNWTNYDLLKVDITMKKVGAVITLITFIIAAIAFCATFARADVPSGKHLVPSTRVIEPSEVVIIVTGYIKDGKVLGSEDRTYTSIRIAPQVYALPFDTSWLFCGYVGDEFNGKSGLITISFEARSHEMYQGIGCHALISVKENK